MPPVGPSLPPHLSKRKRSNSSTSPPNSPPSKIQAATAPSEGKRVLGPGPPPSVNPDELAIDESSEDEYGPSIPSASTKPTNGPQRSAVGPSLPPASAKSTGPQRPAVGPSLPAKNPDELDIDDSSEDDYGPSIPSNSKSSATKTKPSSPPPKRRILGPAPPPASLSEMPSHPANIPPADSSDSEDDYGPSLPPPPGSAAEIAYLHSQAASSLTTPQEPAKPQRDEWMLLPPTSSDWSSRIDPTKLKNRKFASGKGAKAPAEKGGGISAIWTETPEEKRRRLEDEVLGRSEKAVNSSSTSKNQDRGGSREDQETERRIREYNERNRGESLVEQRKKGVDGAGKKEEEDDPSKRGFDREKDMALGGKVGHVKKREILNKAQDFGSRFQKGSYL